MTVELRGLQAWLSTLAPEGLPKLREEVAAHDLIEPDAIALEHDPAQARIALVEAEKRRIEARLARREAEPLSDTRRQRLHRRRDGAGRTDGRAGADGSDPGSEDARSEREHDLSHALNDLDRMLADATRPTGCARARSTSLPRRPR